jgi:hypothetical protein
MRLLPMALLSAPAVVLFAVACSSSDPAVTATDAGAAGNDAGNANETGGSDASAVEDSASCSLPEPIDPRASCNDCAEANCCVQATDCADDAECKAFAECTANCLSDAGVPLDGGNVGDASASGKGCVTSCQKAHKSGAATYLALAQCVADACQSDCK